MCVCVGLTSGPCVQEVPPPHPDMLTEGEFQGHKYSGNWPLCVCVCVCVCVCLSLLLNLPLSPSLTKIHRSFSYLFCKTIGRSQQVSPLSAGEPPVSAALV